MNTQRSILLGGLCLAALFNAQIVMAQKLQPPESIKALCNRLEVLNDRSNISISIRNACRKWTGGILVKTDEEIQEEMIAQKCSNFHRLHHDERALLFDKCGLPSAPLPSQKSCIEGIGCTLAVDHPARARTKHFASPELKRRYLYEVLEGKGNYHWGKDYWIKKAQIISQNRNMSTAHQRSGTALRGQSICWEPHGSYFKRASTGGGAIGHTGGWDNGLGMSRIAAHCLARGGIIDAIWD